MIKMRREGVLKVPSDVALRALTKGIRDGVLHFVRDHTRTRVRSLGQGAGGTALKGYSEQPLMVDHPGVLKPKKAPRGGVKMVGGMFFGGGYKQYREKSGLDASKFVFDNLGDAWRDWKVLLYGDNGKESHIGFTKAANAQAAVAATENDRPLLFMIDKRELSMVDEMIVGLINKTFVS